MSSGLFSGIKLKTSMRQWWLAIGKSLYPTVQQLLITVDSGGSNGYRVRLWKLELEKLAKEIWLFIMVSHFPAGTSKWNKIEHRLFCPITQNWRGRPLTSHKDAFHPEWNYTLLAS